MKDGSSVAHYCFRKKLSSERLVQAVRVGSQTWTEHEQTPPATGNISSVLHDCFRTVSRNTRCSSYPLMTPIGRSFIHFSLMPAAWPVTYATCCFNGHFPYIHGLAGCTHFPSFVLKWTCASDWTDQNLTQSLTSSDQARFRDPNSFYLHCTTTSYYATLSTVYIHQPIFHTFLHHRPWITSRRLDVWALWPPSSQKIIGSE